MRTVFLMAVQRVSGDAFQRVTIILALLMGLLFIGVIGVYIVRRRMRREHSASREGFTLQDLRMLHASGELTDDEFQRARNSMIGRVTAEHSTDGEEQEQIDGLARHAVTDQTRDSDNAGASSYESDAEDEENTAQRPDKHD